MGPGGSSSEKSTRPKFSWDLKSAPSTDGRGPQEDYADAVERWCDFHDLLEEKNPNRIAPKLRGTMLWSQLSGRARDSARKIPKSVLMSSNGAKAVVAAVHRRDPLSVVSSVYDDFVSVVSARRSDNESFKAFENRFDAAVSRFRSHGDSIAVPEPLLALMLLNGARVAESQKVSILAASVTSMPDEVDIFSVNPKSEKSSSSEDDTEKDKDEEASSSKEGKASASDIWKPLSTADYLNHVKYASVASVLRQSNGYQGSSRPSSSSSNAATSTVSSNSKSSRKFKKNNFGKMNAEQLAKAKLKNACHVCHKFGHWADAHNPDGSLKPGTNSFDKPSKQTGDAKKDSSSNNPPVANFLAFLLSSEDQPENTLVSLSATNSQRSTLGPLVDDGAPFSAIGFVELSFHSRKLIGGPIVFDPLPAEINGCTHWQFGIGEHASSRRQILGSVVLKLLTDTGNLITVRHLVIEGSSQWVLGRNITRVCDILHIGQNSLQLPYCENEFVTMVDQDGHSHIPFNRFIPSFSQSSEVLSSNSQSSTAVSTVHTSFSNLILNQFLSSVENSNLTENSHNNPPTQWSSIKKLVDRVHRHVCGHASYSDIRTLLVRNNLWSEEVQHYLAHIISECNSCKASATPPPNRRVSLSSLNRELNEVVCIDHMHLENVTLFHAMDTATRYSAAHVVQSTNLEEAVLAFESCWISQFWPPSAVHADGAFCKGVFMSMLKSYDIQLRLVPPNRHQKNMLEPRHGPIRSIFIRLRDSEPDTSSEVLAIRAVRISNNLYGSDVLSAFEAAKGYTSPINSKSDIVPVDEELREAHANLVARRKLTRILRSHSLKPGQFKPGDLVQVYTKRGNQKRGKWLSPRQVIDIDLEAGMLSVPGLAGRPITVAFEDVRAAHVSSDITLMVQDAIDQLDEGLVEIIQSSEKVHSDGNSSVSIEILPENELPENDQSSTSFDGINEIVEENLSTDQYEQVEEDLSPIQDENVEDKLSSSQIEHNEENLSTIQIPAVGDRIEVFWSDDNKFYPGVVSSITDDGKHNILYDDYDVELLNMSDETWRPESSNNALSIQAVSLPSEEQSVLSSMMEVFGNKPFLRHEAQGFPQFPLVNAYKSEENEFMKNVKAVNRKSVKSDANVISSHVIYKIKINDDGSLKLKARIAPHGNEDSDKTLMRTDCCMCSPVGIRIILSVATFRRWRIVRIDVKTAFLQTGPASRSVYVIPPYESKNRSDLWLLLAAVYGLVNSNAKWQVKSDSALVSFGLVQSVCIPQLFMKVDDNQQIQLVLIKIVDDILITGTDEYMRSFINSFGSSFNLGEVVPGPGKLRFFGLNIIQEEDFSCSIDGDEKLFALEPYPLSRVRRRQKDDIMNAIEKSAFMSLNASIGWLGSTASLLCSFYSSHLQQKLKHCNVSSLVSQVSILKLLKRYGTLTKYVKESKFNLKSATLLAFADASHGDSGSQLCFIVGIVFGKVQKGQVIHFLNWSSHKSRRPVRSTPAAETLAAGEAIDEIVALKDNLSTIYGLDISIAVLVDSKDLFGSLSSQRQPIDKSIRNDINAIRFYYETSLDFFGWIRGSCNPADVGTKLNSPLTELFILTSATGIIQFDLESMEIATKQLSLG